MQELPLKKRYEEINRKNVGFVLITDKKNKLLGILTDGDVRRMISKGISFEGKIINEMMTRDPKTIDENVSLAQDDGTHAKRRNNLFCRG